MIKISASNLHRYFICPAAINHEQEFIKKEQSKYAQEGTRLHDEMQKSFEGKPEDFDKNLHAKKLVELLSEILGLHTEYILKRCFVEEKYKKQYRDFSLIGTPDFVFVDIDKKTVNFTIIDYKFGYNLVPAKGNVQLLSYTVLLSQAILSLIGLTDWVDKDIKINVGIYQNEQLDFTQLPFIEIEQFEHTLLYTLEEAKKNIYNPNEIACKWCSHRPDCNALQKVVQNTQKQIESSIGQNMTEQDKFEYRKSLIQSKKLVEYALEDAENYFKGNLSKGMFYDFVELKTNGSMKSWTKDLSENEIADELTKMMGVKRETFFDKKLKSPAQLLATHPEIPANLIEIREKAKSLKIKEVKKKNLTEDLF